MNIDPALSFVDQLGASLLHDPSIRIIGLAVGRKDQGPVIGLKAAQEGFCISAFVKKKLSTIELSVQNLSDIRDHVAQALFRINLGAFLAIRPQDDIDVVEIGDAFRVQPHPYTGSHHAAPPVANTQKWFDVLRPGIGIANAHDYPNSLSAGTLGFFVDDGTSVYLVSSNHVIAREDAALPNESIVQPATLDLSGSDISRLITIRDLVGQFGIAEFTTAVPVHLHGAVNPPPVNRVDAAIARIITNNRKDVEPGRLPYAGRILGKAAPYDVDPSTGSLQGSGIVYKVGRTTGFTEGYVSNVAAVVNVEFAGGTATFVDQIAIRPTSDNTGYFSEPGDSGSPLLTAENQIAGLLFSGGPTSIIS